MAGLIVLGLINTVVNIWGVYTLYTHFQGGFWLFFIAYLASSFKISVND